MAMTKADIVNAVFEKIGGTKTQAVEVVETVFDSRYDNSVGRNDNQAVLKPESK